MPKALRLGIRSPHELRLIRMLAGDVIDFEDLSSREKLMLYNSPMDITQIVEEEKIRDFEREMSLNNALENEDSIRGIIRTITSRLKMRLEHG